MWGLGILTAVYSRVIGANRWADRRGGREDALYVVMSMNRRHFMSTKSPKFLWKLAPRMGC